MRTHSGLLHPSGPILKLGPGRFNSRLNCLRLIRLLRFQKTPQLGVLKTGSSPYPLKEAQVLIQAWRRHYNTIRPHSSLGYRPPAPETLLPAPLMPPYVEGVPV